MLPGLISGLAGTGAVAAFGPLERRALGAAPPYDPAALAGRLVPGLSPEAASRLGRVMRWSYGPAIGLIWAHAPHPRSALAEGLGLGAAVLGFELLALPATGAAPPVRSWPRGAVGLLAAQVMAFGLVAAVIRRAGSGC